MSGAPMPGSFRLLVLPVLFLLVAGTSGCSSGLYPVKGKVVFKDGTPLKSGIVVFESLDHDRVMARGDIGSGGTVSLNTHQPGGGAVPGHDPGLWSPPRPSHVYH